MSTGQPTSQHVASRIAQRLGDGTVVSATPHAVDRACGTGGQDASTTAVSSTYKTTNDTTHSPVDGIGDFDPGHWDGEEEEQRLQVRRSRPKASAAVNRSHDMETASKQKDNVEVVVHRPDRK